MNNQSLKDISEMLSKVPPLELLGSEPIFLEEWVSRIPVGTHGQLHLSLELSGRNLTLIASEEDEVVASVHVGMIPDTHTIVNFPVGLSEYKGILYKRLIVEGRFLQGYKRLIRRNREAYAKLAELLL